jgi:hypothetical protein
VLASRALKSKPAAAFWASVRLVGCGIRLRPETTWAFAQT